MTTVQVQITEPGVYDMPAEDYHDDPAPGGSLSASGARRLLPPSCPARFRWEQQHPSAPKKEFDYGHAAHQLVLGAGPDIVVVEAGDWRTKKAREQRDAAHAAGKVPLLEDDYARVVEMAAALRAHPLASVLFDPAHGDPERSLFWFDEDFGIWRRARLDWLPHSNDARRMIVPDYKSTRSAFPEDIGRAFHSYGYHQQAAWYLDAVTALGLAREAVFLFVCQEKEPPYLVTVAEPDDTAMRVGHDLNRQAMEIYRDCVASGVWPGYSDDVERVSLPPWAARRHLEEIW